jgi:hypothetical protein
MTMLGNISSVGPERQLFASTGKCNHSRAD